MQTIPDVPKELWLAGAAAAVLGVVYLWAKGLRGATSGAVTAAGNAAAGLVDGIGNAGVAVTNAAGNAFQDITQATLQVPKTDISKCAADTAKGSTLAASFSCKASDFLAYLFSPTQKAPAPSGPTVSITAPGGGIVPALDPFLNQSGYLTGPNDPLLYNPGSSAWINAVPSDPTPLNAEPVLVNVAGLRG